MLTLRSGIGPMPTRPSATIEALSRVRGKAELVDGEVVRMSPTGFRPGRAATAIAASLRAHERKHCGGFAVGDNVGFLVQLPRRQSFSPDAAWYTGTFEGLGFAEGAPAFAAEVRSEGDYGSQADAAIAAKRDDYFAAGTLVVWDVDLIGEDVIRVYRADAPGAPTLYRRGQMAEAEPAVSGWTMPFDELLE
jgi:Uma2 family endonuclease